MSEELIAKYLLEELRAYGLVQRENEVYVFQGASHDYMIEMKAFAVELDKPRPLRFREPFPDLATD